MLNTGFHIVQSNHPEAILIIKVPKLKILFTFQPSLPFQYFIMIFLNYPQNYLF